MPSPGIMFTWYVLIIFANLIKWGIILTVLVSLARSARIAARNLPLPCNPCVFKDKREA